VDARSAQPGRGLTRQEESTVLARTILGRTLAVTLAVAISQAAVPVAEAAAAPHLVDSTQVARRLLEGAKSREDRIQLFERALATPGAEAQARVLGLDPARLRAAIPHLSDQELQDLTQRASRVQDVAAGHHHGDDALVILGIILLLAGIAVLIAASGNGPGCGCY
jgi:hypothetical protein